jgi:hypothetical protein
MASNKKIESMAFEQLRMYVDKHLPEAGLIDCRSKKRNATAIGDAILTCKDCSTHIEIKGSMSKTLPTNLRFTHQTISAAQNQHLIVAVVWNLNHPTPNIGFFALASFQQQIIVEPHFIVQSKHLKGKVSIPGRFFDDLSPLMARTALPLDLTQLLNTTVASHVRKKTARESHAEKHDP